MKKRIAAIVLAACLTLALGAASAADYTAGAYYSIAYPDTMTLDDTIYADQSDSEYKWLFLLNGDNMVIDATIESATGYEAGFSLYAAGDEERDAYIDEVLDSFSDSSPTFLSTVETTANGIPFYVFLMEDADGPYYYAETIASGNSINFYCYYSDNGEPDEALMDALTPVLQSFRPVVE